MNIETRDLFVFFFLRQVLSLNMELTNLAMLDSHELPGSGPYPQHLRLQMRTAILRFP